MHFHSFLHLTKSSWFEVRGQRGMVTWVVEVTEFNSEARCDLWGHFETAMASKASEMASKGNTHGYQGDLWCWFQIQRQFISLRPLRPFGGCHSLRTTMRSQSQRNQYFPTNLHNSNYFTAVGPLDKFPILFEYHLVKTVDNAHINYWYIFTLPWLYPSMYCEGTHCTEGG